MKYHSREKLANDFAETIRHCREESWQAFSEAAEQEALDPYVALAHECLSVK